MKTLPKQTMREFFARADVRALQDIQKANPFDSDAHRKATKALSVLADAVGAGEYFR